MGDFEKMWNRLDLCRYGALAVQDETTRTVIQELCDVMMDLVDTLDAKEKKDEHNAKHKSLELPQ